MTLKSQPDAEFGSGTRLAFSSVNAFLSTPVGEACPPAIGCTRGLGGVKALTEPLLLMDGQSGYFCRLKPLMLSEVPGNGQTSVKSKSWYSVPLRPLTRFCSTPCDPIRSPRSPSEGTAWLYSVGVFSSRNSSEKKKYVFFRSVLYT